jgi:thiamine pyrophosphate-dependent acetolactate synthase large subunit-like protein
MPLRKRSKTLFKSEVACAGDVSKGVLPNKTCEWKTNATYGRVPNARASCLSHSFQSVGLGLASTVGLAIANPGKLAVLGAGNGGFLMSISDLETTICLGLRMCILKVH